MRPLIQYDLDEPPAPPTVGPQPPTKKRRRNHYRPQKPLPQFKARHTIQHWDDPGNSNVGMVYDEQESGSWGTHLPVPGASEKLASYAEDNDGDGDYEDADGEEQYDEAGYDDEMGAEQEEESRELSHQEIWDDSALVDAWNSAEAEYEAYHGKSKEWKTDPVKKSPLWYNKPYTGPSKSKPPSTKVVVEEQDSAPIDFNTFVPTHDPSLSTRAGVTAPPPPGTSTPFTMPHPSTTMMVSRDEAFNNALSAMYWSGYWTAVYHCQSQSSGKNTTVSGETTENENIDADGYEEDLVPSQR